VLRENLVVIGIPGDFGLTLNRSAMCLILPILLWSLCAAFRSRSDRVLESLVLSRRFATFAGNPCDAPAVSRAPEQTVPGCIGPTSAA